MQSKTRSLIGVVLFPVIMGALLFLTADDFAWGMGWAYVVHCFLISILLSGLFTHKHPDLGEERKRALRQAKWWDKILLPILTILLPWTILAVSGWDHRYHWTTSLTLIHQAVFFCFSVIGVAITYWAMLTNRFFSSAVRIQFDRGHVVVTNGPYRLVRHPGYLGAILYNLTLPLALGSLWGAALGLVEMFFLVIRTTLEDRTLRNELPGYREYAEKVRYRLFPFLW